MTSSLFFLAAGIRPSSVTAEIVSCAVTSMDFFDRLQEQGEGLFFFKSNQKGISPYKISTFSSRGLMRLIFISQKYNCEKGIFIDTLHALGFV